MEYKIAAACLGVWVCLGLCAAIRNTQTLGSSQVDRNCRLMSEKS